MQKIDFALKRLEQAIKIRVHKEAINYAQKSKDFAIKISDLEQDTSIKENQINPNILFN